MKVKQNTVGLHEPSVSGRWWHSTGGWLTGSFPPMACIQNLWSSSDRACTVSTVPGLGKSHTTSALGKALALQYSGVLGDVSQYKTSNVLRSLWKTPSAKGTCTLDFQQLQIWALLVIPAGLWVLQSCGTRWISSYSSQSEWMCGLESPY